jgi:uncharacterized protein
MYLVDTNVWLEHLLNQTKAQEAFRFITELDAAALSISHFSLHSICVILSRQKRAAKLDQFINDLFIQCQVVLRAGHAASAARQTSNLSNVHGP